MSTRSPLQVLNARRSRRLAALFGVEHLESRQLLTTVSLNVDTSGSWNDPDNWSTGNIPQPGDDMVIDRAAANPTVTFTGSDNLVYHSLTVKDRLSVAGGILTVANDSRGQQLRDIAEVCREIRGHRP